MGSFVCNTQKPSPWLIYKTNSTFIVSTIIDLKLIDIHGTSFPHSPYKLLPSTKHNFTHMSLFLILLLILLSFSSHTFSWACGSLYMCESQKFLYLCIFVQYLSWISAKLVSALLPCVLYLSYYFQPEENT